jgi:hypothetical protein
MIMSLPKSSVFEPTRVRRSSSVAANERIDAALERAIERHMNLPRPRLTKRILELEREWSIERWLETNASTLTLAGVVLTALGYRKALWLSGTVAGFLLLHGVSGWCPPLPVLRRLGVRTRGEIDSEKFALKYLRGDFEPVAQAAREGRFSVVLLSEAVRRLD